MLIVPYLIPNSVLNVVVAAGAPVDVRAFAVCLLLTCNVALYGAMLFLVYRSIRASADGKRVLALMLTALAAAPLLHYGYHWVLNGVEPARRRAEVAAWPRVAPDA